VHTKVVRDCGGGGNFSAQKGGFGVVRHETGHAPFGLSDEYCCDGGYWQPSTDPNLYSSQANCANDAPNVTRTASACHSITVNGGGVWWTSDPASGDLMVDNA